MRRQDALTISCCAAILVTAALYVLEPRAPIYYPVEHSWRWEKTPGVAMFWYGRSLIAIGGGVITLLVARPLLARSASAWDQGAPPWLSKLLSGMTLAALVAALGHIVLHEYWNWMR